MSRKKEPKAIHIAATGGFIYVLLDNGELWELGHDNLTGSPLWDEVALPWGDERDK